MRPGPPTVWFNKYLSNTGEIINLLKESRQPEEFRILCTHPRASYARRAHSDLFEQEPSGLSDADYIEYCLDVARRHEVNIFLPRRKLLPILHQQQRFAALGVRVVATGDAATVALLDNKAHLYAALAGTDSALPAYAVVHDLASFDAAWTCLRPHYPLLCYKPAISVYGIGFHIVAESGHALEQCRAGDPLYIQHEDARQVLGQRARFPELLLMEYLPGPERSVDCLAREGELLCCVVRRKEKGGQVLEDNPDLVKVVRDLTARLRLDHLFNVQFRDAHRRSYLLEINPRMSGGLPFACQSGLILPYWAIRLALGTANPQDIPQPRTDIWVPQPEPVSSL